jgi:hypothetical protein
LFVTIVARLQPLLVESAMTLPRFSLFALCIVLFGTIASGAAYAQEEKWREDFKTLVPPVVPLPPNSQLNPGAVGGTQTPYTSAPLQSPTQSPTTQPAPGLKLSIPSR